MLIALLSSLAAAEPTWTVTFAWEPDDVETTYVVKTEHLDADYVGSNKARWLVTLEPREDDLIDIGYELVGRGTMSKRVAKPLMRPFSITMKCPVDTVEECEFVAGSDVPFVAALRQDGEGKETTRIDYVFTGIRIEVRQEA